eukprot:TRINITY_DN1817_c0_g1_i1.p1 TRINITY_DN1817_c0_g1~~TRINITY_DN1817_c0_g1_i1.p1  ORF type:complete len:263 (-),score=83.60 TRINITY_DN1817_c0_g1_i1:82-870(-)
MSKFKVKGVCGNETRTVELDRGIIGFEFLRKVLDERFPGKGVKQICYKYKDGSTRALSTDQHLLDAIKDCEKAGNKNFQLILYASGPSYPAPTGAAAAPAVSSSPSSGSLPPSPTPSTTPTAPVSTRPTTSPAPAAAPKPPPTSSSAHVCHKCGQSITSQGVQALGKPWHKDCFACTVCSTKLTGLGAQFHEHEGNPYCTTHYRELFAPKCGGCNQALTGMYINVNGQNYHEDCFVCSKCRKPLAGGGYYEKNGQPLCQTCI